MNVDTLENMLQKGQDNFLLRFGLGQAYLKQKQPANAITHLLKAIEFDAQNSAARKLLGKAYAENGDTAQARDTYTTGIELAEKNGDIQSKKEMQVFLKRLDK